MKIKKVGEMNENMNPLMGQEFSYERAISMLEHFASMDEKSHNFKSGLSDVSELKGWMKDGTVTFTDGNNNMLLVKVTSTLR